MVYALGRADDLVGVSQECNFPPEVKKKPVVVRGAVDYSGLSASAIDAAVSRLVKEGKSPYTIDQEKLRELAPDIILTQALCRVCAPSQAEAAQAQAIVPEGTRVLYLSPRTIDDVFEDIRRVGEAIDALEEAKRLIYDIRQRATQVQCLTYLRKRKPRVMVLEWLDPLYSAGHWIPEMIEVAGGIPVGAAGIGKESERIDWKDVAEAGPDVLILASCGFRLDQVMKDAAVLKNCPPDVPAFKNRQIFAVDADSYITRPGPRVVDGIELLANILNPDLELWQGADTAFRQVSDL